MDNGIHFISGLPRSGSSLLSGLLRQNPRLHAHISSPVASLAGALQSALSGRSEYHPLVSDVQRRAVLNGVFDSYYAGVHGQKTVIDTNRSWTGRLPLLANLHPEAKVICCVRPLAWIVDSFERLVRESPLEPSKIYNYSPGGNVYTRCDHLNGPKGVIGLAFACL
jgi:sulfotransferase